MELKLVYRFLRKMSDWEIAGYYSDVHVQGYENVPKDGPVIMWVKYTLNSIETTELHSAATHHNELIDIATLGIQSSASSALYSAYDSCNYTPSPSRLFLGEINFV